MTPNHIDKTTRVTMQLEPAPHGIWGPTLADLRTRLGGCDHGEFTDPRYGTKHAVDLTRWAHLPPDTRFKLRFGYPVDGSRRARRRMAIESLLTSPMPHVADQAQTLDEILDSPLPSQKMVPQPDGTYQDQKWELRTARHFFKEMPMAPSRQRLRRSLAALVDRGEVLRAGKGTRADPYRYWRRSPRELGMRGRLATEAEKRELWRRITEAGDGS